MNKYTLIWLVGFVFGGYGIAGLFVSYQSLSWLSAAGSCIAIVGGFGLMKKKYWSQYFIYLYSAIGIASWCYVVYATAQQGWP